LHQAVEAKHQKDGVQIKQETQTMATVTLQNFFKLYKKLAGMTGTAKTEENEFWKIYKLDVISIPTNMPMRRKEHKDKVYRTDKEKWDAVVAEIERIHAFDALELRDGTLLTGTVKGETPETVDFEDHATRERKTYQRNQITTLEYRGRPILI